MTIFLDFFPIFVFFIVYKFAGIYYATASAIAISALQIIALKLFKHEFKPLQLITFLIILVLGSITIFLHNPIFIKWKPSVIYWLFAIVFFGSQLWTAVPLLQRMLQNQITLENDEWKKLNSYWGAFFLFLGTLNIYVVYHFDTNFWVNFKIFGILGLMLLFIIGQSIYLSRRMKPAIQQNSCQLDK